MGGRGVLKAKKIRHFFFKLFFQFFFHGHCRALQLAYFQSLNKSTKGSIYFFVTRLSLQIRYLYKTSDHSIFIPIYIRCHIRCPILASLYLYKMSDPSIFIPIYIRCPILASLYLHSKKCNFGLLHQASKFFFFLFSFGNLYFQKKMYLNKF